MPSWAKTRYRGLVRCPVSGTPVVALLLGMLAGVMLLRRGERLTQLNRLVERSIEKSAVVLMITGAGGGFGAVIKATGVGDAIAGTFTQLHLPAVLFPFLLAMALTTATGSLTVSMVTRSSVVASMLGSLGLSPEFAVALIGAGSLCVIHANSSFFWLLSRLHDVPPHLLYRTYSVQSVCMSFSGLLGAANALVRRRVNDSALVPPEPKHNDTKASRKSTVACASSSRSPAMTHHRPRGPFKKTFP